MLTIANRDELLADAERRSNSARNASIMANAEVKRAELNANRDKILNDYTTDVDYLSSWYNDREAVI
jgi:hypothetical protein